MKHSIKRISKSALSVILALMMVVSTMAVGMVVANATTIPANTIIYLDLSSATSFASSDSVYMSVVGEYNKNYHFSNISTDKVASYQPKKDTNWVKMDPVSGSDNIYKATVTSEPNFGKVSFWNKDMNNWNDVNDANAIGAVEYDGTHNMFVVGSAFEYHKDKKTNCYGGTWSTYSGSTGGGGGETTTNLATSTNTLLVAYDKRTDNPWDYTHIWYSRSGDKIYENSTLTSTGISGLTYYNFEGIDLTASSQINFIVKNGKEWNTNNSNNIEKSDFVKGVQWYIYNDGSGTEAYDATAKYTPIAIKSLSTTEVTSGQDNTITFTPAGGVPYFLSDKGTSANYTLNVFEGADTSGKQIVTNASIANAATYDITWNPTAVTTQTTQKLTFVLSDEIESVSYTTDYTVNPAPIPQLATPEISFDSTTIAAADNSYVTLTVNNHSTYTSLSEVTVTYKLFNGDSEVTTASFDSNGKCQIKEAGTYKVQAVSSDTSKYTNSEYSTAKTITKAAPSVYYIGGRFRVKVDGVDKVIDWNEKNTDANFKFTLVDGETDLYYLNTNCTLAELSAKVSSHNDFQYFKIYDQTNDKLYNATNANLENCSSYSAAETLTECGDGGDTNMRFQSTDTNGTVTLYLKNDNGTLKLYYSLVGDKTPLNAPTIASDRTSLNEEYTTATITVTPATYPDGVDVEYYLYNGSTCVTTTTGTTFTVSSAGTYTVKAYPPADNPNYKESVASNSVTIADGRTPVKLIAKNGSEKLLNLGTTVAKASNTSSSVVEDEGVNITGGIQYTVTKGSTVTVTTTMAADTTTAEKFVYAYVINNKDTYLATEGIAVTGAEDKKYATYSATFTIAEDATETTFTVVPIYYYKACANDGEYIKFYVNAKESTWPNVYNYAYYYGPSGTKDKDTKESDGEWPGQPMLYDSTKQLFYSLVPKSINNQTVSGLTVNNNGSEQTYDFDDFKFIYLSGYDIVRLDLKYKSGHGNTVKDSGNGVNKLAIGASYTTEGTFANPTNGITVSTFDDRWEAFNDINGKPMSLLGKETTDTTNKVYVVSTALYNISNRGQYMTAWYVYKADSSGNLTFVTAACPSDFVPRPYSETQTEKGVNTTAYNTILDAGLGNAPVQIVFEDVQDHDTKNRFDGRWYYAQSDSEVSAYAYYRKYETPDCSGTPSDLLINKDYSKIIAETELINDDGIVIGGKNSTLKKEISVVSSPLAGYIFDHWSVVDKAGNIIIDKLENVGSSFTTTLDQEMHYVANFRKATQGQIEIKHSKYSGVGAKNGLGYYRLEVQVLKENGEWTSVSTGSGTGANGHTVKISDLTENDLIVRIKLITETAGENTFRYWYTDSSDGTEIIEDPDGIMTWKAVDSENYIDTTEPTGKNGILTYTFDTEVWKLFSGKISQLNFYSDIAPMTKNYKLTYIYDDRFGNQKSYVVTGTHDDKYYEENGSWKPTQKLIYEKAPYIDDLYKDCTWTMTQCTLDGTDATLTADQNLKKYTVDIYDAEGSYETKQLAINSYVKNKAGQFFVANEFIMDGGTKKEFSYWAVYERIVDAAGNVVKGKEVARHFYRKYTLVVLDNYWIEPVYGAEVKDKAYISEPQYSREQTTNADGSVVKDKLYVDFMLAYMSSTGELISSDPTGDKYQTGILIEVDKSVTLKENSTDYSGIIFNSDDSTLESIAKTTTTKNEYTYINSDSATSKRIVFNYRATNTNYNNMNRLDYFVYFNNSKANCSYVMKAYYYVIVEGNVILSDPVYFNLYEVGNSAPNTVTTTS